MKMLSVIIMLSVATLMGCKDKPKPTDIEAHCTMNGYGAGKCTFTNKGKGPGAKCIKVVVFKQANPDGDTVSSDTICSGKVKPKESLSKDLSVPKVNDFCTEFGKSWTKVCAFVVKTDE